MRKLQLLVLSVACCAPVAHAQDRAPDWLRRPTPGNTREVYPVEAMRKGRDGKAVIACTVTVQGTLRDCKVIDERPAGLGFGGAALALAPQFLMKPALKGGVPVEANVNIPINWAGMDAMDTMRPSKDSRVYANIPWRQAPTFDQVLAVYPAKAKASKVGGTAVIDCKIGKEGRLSECRPIRELPKGYGFATAARSLAPLFVTPVKTIDGETAVGSRAHLNITFAASALEGAEPVIGKPKWVAAPRINDVAAVMPEAAKKAKVYRARVTMDCKVVAGGAVDGCKVASEDPAGLGYGDAAVSLARYFKLAVWTDEGLPSVGGSVRIPLRFDLENAVAAAP